MTDCATGVTAFTGPFLQVALPVAIAPLLFALLAWRRPSWGRVLLATLGCAAGLAYGLWLNALDTPRAVAASNDPTLAARHLAFAWLWILPGLSAALWAWHLARPSHPVRRLALYAAAAGALLSLAYAASFPLAVATYGCPTPP